jgi:hypothetical protein
VVEAVKHGYPVVCVAAGKWPVLGKRREVGGQLIQRYRLGRLDELGDHRRLHLLEAVSQTGRGVCYQSGLMPRCSLLLDLHVCAWRCEGGPCSHAVAADSYLDSVAQIREQMTYQCRSEVRGVVVRAALATLDCVGRCRVRWRTSFPILELGFSRAVWARHSGVKTVVRGSGSRGGCLRKVGRAARWVRRCQKPRCRRGLFSASGKFGAGYRRAKAGSWEPQCGDVGWR